MIKPLPTKTDIRNWVDEIITPEKADSESKRFCQILQAVTDADGNWENYELGMIAQHHAFTYTTHFEEAFNEFAGVPKSNYFEEKEKVSEVFETVN